jgi:hypothetical protein
MSAMPVIEVTKKSKKLIVKDIREKLTGALGSFRDRLGEKEFEIRIKKASKLLSRGLDKQPKKKSGKKSETKKTDPVNTLQSVEKA